MIGVELMSGYTDYTSNSTHEENKPPVEKKKKKKGQK